MGNPSTLTPSSLGAALCPSEHSSDKAATSKAFANKTGGVDLSLNLLGGGQVTEVANSMMSTSTAGALVQTNSPSSMTSTDQLISMAAPASMTTSCVSATSASSTGQILRSLRLDAPLGISHEDRASSAAMLANSGALPTHLLTGVHGQVYYMYTLL
ncbi:unnamed protein product [Protopolystoma xenopodis]|uniref:Uncharacterized protein n=1 Tax=Protopolystoma xenopodis TaxID=117903 RepID=A0A448X442_9PLAT|nr:unnamed protein product [Protopolystoma xenopodis]